MYPCRVALRRWLVPHVDSQGGVRQVAQKLPNWGGFKVLPAVSDIE
jgi:hypothetical protein